MSLSTKLSHLFLTTRDNDIGYHGQVYSSSKHLSSIFLNYKSIIINAKLDSNNTPNSSKKLFIYKSASLQLSLHHFPACSTPISLYLEYQNSTSATYDLRKEFWNRDTSICQQLKLLHLLTISLPTKISNLQAVDHKNS